MYNITAGRKRVTVQHPTEGIKVFLDAVLVASPTPNVLQVESTKPEDQGPAGNYKVYMYLSKGTPAIEETIYE